VPLVCCVLFAVACSQRPGAAPTSGNLLDGKAASSASAVSGTATLSDGVAALPGDDWETDLVAQFQGTEAFVTYDLGAVVSLRAVWLQADHNDDYRLMLSEDGEVFEQLWDSPSVRVSGMQDRFSSNLNAMGRYLRLEPLRGDGRYGVSELQVFAEVPAAFPPEVPRRRGTSLELMVRTKVLCFAGAAILCLLLAFQGAPGWWIALCAVLPLWTGLDAVLAVARAWPVDDRQVSLVRSAMAAIAAAAIAREVFSPARIKPQRWVVLSCLGTAALVAVLAFYNLGRPQFWDARAEQPTPVHLLDLRQYYGTAKYFDELGYRGMYLADVAAYVENTPGATLDSLRDTPMRDLTTHRMTTIGAEREKIAVIKQRFTPERWESYKKDSLYFRDVMGKRDYLRYMFDFGGNATPVWISIAHFLFSALDASTTTFLLTGLLDPLLFLVTFAAIGRCFGYRTMFVVMTVFGANDFIMYGSNWGGATLRHDWLMYIGLGACALKRERWALGGFFLALATVIRAFPAITLVTATFPALWWVFDFYRAQRRWPRLGELYEAQRPVARVLGCAGVTIAVLVVATSLRWSLPAWGDWLSKVAKLSADSHSNSIALRGLIAGWEVGHHQLLRARWPLYAAGIAFYVVGVLLACRQKPLERAAIWGLVLIPVVFYAANYYIHIVCLLPLIAVERRTRQPSAGPPVSVSDAWVWLGLLGLCVAQYWTVLVTDRALHFHLATVLLFAALTLILIVQLRADAREGRLDFLARFFDGGAETDARDTQREAVLPNP
jgi:hypothetical protein